MPTSHHHNTLIAPACRLGTVLGLLWVAACGSADSSVDAGADSDAAIRAEARACRNAADRNCCGNAVCESRETCGNCAADCACPPAPTGALGQPCRADGSCDAGLQCDATRTCVAESVDTCVPQPHATSACDGGDVYWFDSCGGREELKQSCAGAGCDAAACLPPAPVVETFALECEAGSRFGAMRLVTATGPTTASAGAWTEGATGTTGFFWNASAPQLPTDRVELPVRLQGGSYRLWVRMAAPAGTQDAIYAGFGAADLRRVYPSTGYAYDLSWQWLGAVDGAPDRLLFNLAAGEHRIAIGNGETGARCDFVVLTSDLGWTPAGWQPTSSPCGDGTCSASESCLSCATDCGSCPPACGDGTCDANESCQSCAADCGSCPPPPPPPPPAGALRVFPGAEGFGTTTAAGRGGAVLRVTNLNDSGPGSFRAAVSASGPRVVVFEIAGTIQLLSTVYVMNPYLTIAGQTAPEPGIQLKDYGLEIADTHDVLVQHLRVRISGGERDGVRVNAASKVVYNIVIDHVTVNWATDENMSVWGGTADPGVHDVTISNCLIAESGYGLLVGGNNARADHVTNVSVIHNLFADNAERDPLITNNTNAFVANNLAYNATWSFTSFDGAYGPSKASFIGNHYVTGPANGGSAIYGLAAGGVGGAYYLEDVLVTGRIQVPLYNSRMAPFLVDQAPIFDPSVVVLPSADVWDSVTRSAGARPAFRDSVERRIVNEVLTATGTLQRSGVFPADYATPRTRAFSAGTNPNGDDDGDGYTNLEEILHQMAAAVEGR